MRKATNKRHVNIPIFIPHLGCPNNCVFCNQRSISGKMSFDISSVEREIDEALSTVDNRKSFAEIAYFGGSFTGIERELMTSLLEIAEKYMKSGAVRSLRCSTRPDYINTEILEILKSHGMTTVELGLQSISEKVLRVTKRGHTFEDEQRACRLIVESGLKLVGQMMIGLPESTLADELATARFIADSGAVGARIYPTVVFRESELCRMTADCKYQPLTLKEAVFRTKEVMKIFINAGVDIIRVGLCASDNLISDDTYYAGPNHEAIGELAQGELYYDAVCAQIENTENTSGSHLSIYAPSGATSKVVGQKKINRQRLIERFALSSVKVIEDKTLAEYEVRVEIKDKEKKDVS